MEIRRHKRVRNAFILTRQHETCAQVHRKPLSQALTRQTDNTLTVADHMEDLVAGLQGPPGPPGRGKMGRPGNAGQVGLPGKGGTRTDRLHGCVVVVVRSECFAGLPSVCVCVWVCVCVCARVRACVRECGFVCVRAWVRESVRA